MTSLFESIEEAKDERRAIQMADGIETTTKELHRCVVQSVISSYFSDGDPKPFFEDVQKHRGKVAADKLRDDCRAEWIKRKEHGA